MKVKHLNITLMFFPHMHGYIHSKTVRTTCRTNSHLKRGKSHWFARNSGVASGTASQFKRWHCFRPLQQLPCWNHILHGYKYHYIQINTVAMLMDNITTSLWTHTAEYMQFEVIHAVLYSSWHYLYANVYHTCAVLCNLVYVSFVLMLMDIFCWCGPPAKGFQWSGVPPSASSQLFIQHSPHLAISHHTSTLTC